MKEEKLNVILMTNLFYCLLHEVSFNSPLHFMCVRKMVPFPSLSILFFGWLDINVDD